MFGTLQLGLGLTSRQGVGVVEDAFRFEGDESDLWALEGDESGNALLEGDEA